MKPDVFAPRLSSAHKSTAKSFGNPLAPLLGALLLLVCLAPTSARADNSPFSIIRRLAREGVKCPEYVAEVVRLVKAHPHEAEAIIAEAVNNQPPCACELVKAGIQAITPNNGTPDPNQVASMVALIVQTIQTTHPDLLETIVSCATDADPEAGPQILAAISSIFSGPQGAGIKSNVQLGNSIMSPTPTPTPTPPAPTPNPAVTQSKTQ